ncbi:S-adenosyl-L-methionine-dependent methyltransferase [Chlamydoabsidia padenii]|nr:S-adenosyl-L-methionine-dependent methyltransferase [Chlamydoabsidia padenii]
MPFYLIQFAQSHEEFRLPEFESLAVLENVKYNYSKDSYRLDSPFFKVELESDEDARRIVKRSILVKRIYELWGEGATYDQVNTQVKADKTKWTEYQHTSFKFSVSAFGWTLTAKEQLAIINSFSYLGFEGDIDLVNPQVKFGVMEDYGHNSAQKGIRPPLHYIYMGRLVASGSRELVQKYNLKKRHYLGTTSMDAELSLVMANQALADSGKLVYDPFVGTGSFLFTCAHFGSFTLGSDIDGRQIRGKSKDRGVKSNIEQYNLQGRVLDSLVFDVTKNPWRCDDWLDAIVTDPPYGVRAGAKKLGRKDEDKKPLQLRSYEGVPMHLREDYYPPTKPYEMSEVLSDLLSFSAKHLRIGGRLVYWLPTVVDEYSNTDVPQHPSMILISNSEQNFGQWSRRLITMEKVKSYDAQDHTTLSSSGPSDENAPKSMGHYLFREKYFSFGRQNEDGKKIE